MGGQSMSCKAASREKTLLIAASILCVGALTVIALYSLANGDKISAQSATLVGVIVTALATYSKDSVQAVRAFWQDDRLGKMTDQIASSTPTEPVIGTKPAGTPDDPVAVTDVGEPKP